MEESLIFDATSFTESGVGLIIMVGSKMRPNLIICRITGKIMLCIQLDKLRIEANCELSYHDISI